LSSYAHKTALLIKRRGGGFSILPLFGLIAIL